MKQMKLTKLTALTVMGLALATPALAQYQLVVNLWDVSAVTITATTNYATVNSSSTTSDNGVELLDFYTFDPAASFAGSGPGSGTLIGGNSGAAYEYFSYDNYSQQGNRDLALYSAMRNIQTFSTTASAFTGSMTIDLSGLPAVPPVGLTGDILSGAFGSYGVVIGRWQTISAAPTPEPGTLALAGFGGAGAWLLVRRRK